MLAHLRIYSFVTFLFNELSYFVVLGCAIQNI
jgi:hypothetical protein